jgi:tetratricopeptide (TPR) repeat protein
LVETPDFTVEVIGTRFLVDLNGAGEQAVVIVSDGKVNVRGAKIGKHSLAAGEALEIDSVLEVRLADNEDLIALNDLLAGSPSSQPAPALAHATPRPDAGEFAGIGSDGSKNDVVMEPAGASPDSHEATDSDLSSISKWREWVIEGRLDEARFALRDHLKQNPSDANAWSLLADCERKRSNWAQAVVAYDKLVALSEGERANRARFKAALIIQDRLGDHEGAVKALEQFLAQGGNGTLLEARAKVRLAGSLMALNKPERAREYLLWVVEKSNDAAMISKAKYMLEQK